jgi:hypothetical protein
VVTVTVVTVAVVEVKVAVVAVVAVKVVAVVIVKETVLLVTVSVVCDVCVELDVVADVAVVVLVLVVDVLEVEEVSVVLVAVVVTSRQLQSGHSSGRQYLSGLPPCCSPTAHPAPWQMCGEMQMQSWSASVYAGYRHGDRVCVVVLVVAVVVDSVVVVVEFAAATSCARSDIQLALSNPTTTSAWSSPSLHRRFGSMSSVPVWAPPQPPRDRKPTPYVSHGTSGPLMGCAVGGAAPPGACDTTQE